MNKFKEASENIKKLQQFFKGLIDLSEEMDKVDSLENYVSELEAKKDNLIGEVSYLIDKKDLALKQINDLKEQSLKINEDAKIEANKLIASAKTAADDLKAQANSYAEEKLKAIKESEKEHEYFKENYKKAIDSMEIEFKEKQKKLEEVNLALEKIKGGI